MTQSYQLPLQLLLAVMQEVRGMHLLRATLPPLRAFSKNPCVAELLIQDGKLLACQIYDAAQGVRLLHQDRALSALASLGELNWSLLPPPQQPSQEKNQEHSVRQTLVREHIPIHRLNGPMPKLPHRHRQVFSLLNGQRTISDIAQLLHLSSQEIQYILNDLKQHNLIIYQ